ncbi:MAG: MmcQ/YjbR family DNA-binding protein [Bacteroidota bacterium]|nr:MmcQ/YjbR family DNA-binding protein [Bacteroidota bacterium]
MIAKNGNYWPAVRDIMAEFPQTLESTSYGTPAFKVNKKLLVRLKEDGQTLVLHSDDRDVLLKKDPSVFFFTEHYANYPFVLVRLHKIPKGKLRAAIIQSWKELASRKQLDAYMNK